MKTSQPERGEPSLGYPHPHLSLVPDAPAPEGEGASDDTVEQPQPAPARKRSRIKPALLLLLLMLLSVVVIWGYQESKTSAMQARYFSKLAKRLTYKVEPGPSNAIRFPSDSPYDERLGYANMPDYL